MKSRITEDFVSLFNKLPHRVQENARKSYRLWRENPAHPGLHFKKVHDQEPLYSVRIGRGWRALGLLEEDTITWFWIGSHADYDHLIG
ncbi:MAG: type II toxin-antitoxin system RelE family toxin [Thermoanaerobaculia bacterium]